MEGPNNYFNIPGAGGLGGGAGTPPFNPSAGGAGGGANGILNWIQQNPYLFAILMSTGGSFLQGRQDQQNFESQQAFQQALQAINEAQGAAGIRRTMGLDRLGLMQGDQARRDQQRQLGLAGIGSPQGMLNEILDTRKRQSMLKNMNPNFGVTPPNFPTTVGASAGAPASAYQGDVQGLFNAQGINAIKQELAPHLTAGASMSNLDAYLRNLLNATGGQAQIPDMSALGYGGLASRADAANKAFREQLLGLEDRERQEREDILSQTNAGIEQELQRSRQMSEFQRNQQARNQGKGGGGNIFGNIAKGVGMALPFLF